MKRDKNTIILLAVNAFVALIIIFVCAWSVTEKNIESIKSINFNGNAFSNHFVTYDLNKQLSKGNFCINAKGNEIINNHGSKNAIVEISFKDAVSYSTEISPPENLKEDFIMSGETWYLKNKKLDEIVSVNMDLNKWIKIGENFYAVVPVGGNILVDDIFLNTSDDLYGVNGVASEDSKITISYKVSVAWADEETVENYFGDDVAETIPRQWYEL